MAACSLRIELAESHAVRVGGESISGTVTVVTDRTVNCSGLVVKTYWTTHGRGNVESGDVDSLVVFQGTWEPGSEYRYPFTLRTAAWPPTYYGTTLNVSHFVAAQAKVPWASDPKSQREFTLVVADAPEDLKPTRAAAKGTSAIGWIIAIALLAVFGAMFGVLLIFLLPLIALGAGGYWFFRVFLPRRLLGNVECLVEPARLVAGATVTGKLRFTPRRDVTIDGIRWSVTCTERCVSGSGSDRKTHRQEVFQRSEPIVEAGVLRMGQTQAFEFTTVVPEQAPVSIKFTDNEVLWVGELRVDIPRWPDWVKTIPLTVVPRPVTPEAFRSSDGISGAPPVVVAAEEETWFGTMLEQVERSVDEPDRLRSVLEAVGDQVFSLRVDLSGVRTVAPRTVAPEIAVRETGLWTFACYRPQDVEICLLWPTPLQPPGEKMANWRGKATVLGYDDEVGCLLMRVVRD